MGVPGGTQMDGLEWTILKWMYPHTPILGNHHMGPG